MSFSGTLAEMTFREVERAVERGAGVLVPVGVVEEHGPHLPLATDVYAAHQLCRLVQERLSEEPSTELLIAPPVYWGINAVTSAFVGSFRVRPETAAALLGDVLESLVDDGFSNVLLVNHHGDRAHNDMLLEVVRRQHSLGRPQVRWIESTTMISRLGASADEPWLVAYEDPPELASLRFAPQLGVHAHDLETAFVARYFPELVDYEALAALEPTDLSEEDLAEWRHGGERARRITPDGYFGAPAPIDPMLWRSYPMRADAMAAAVLRGRAAA